MTMTKEQVTKGLMPANHEFQNFKVNIALYMIIATVSFFISVGQICFAAYYHNWIGVFFGISGITLFTIWFMILLSFSKVINMIVKLFKEFGFEKDL